MIIFVHTHTHAHSHTHTHTLSLSLFLSHTRTHNLSVSLSHTHAHTHTCTQTHTRIHESTQIHKCIYDMLILCVRSWRAGQSILSNYSHSPIANIATIIASACMCVSICINRYIHVKYIRIIYMYTIHMLYTMCIYYIIHCGIHLRKICDCCCPTADRTVRACISSYDVLGLTDTWLLCQFKKQPSPNRHPRGLFFSVIFFGLLFYFVFIE